MYILKNGEEVSAEQIKSAVAEKRAVLVHSRAIGHTETGLMLDGVEHSTRNECYSVWDEIWTTKPNDISEALRAAYYNPGA